VKTGVVLIVKLEVVRVCPPFWGCLVAHTRVAAPRLWLVVSTDYRTVK